MLSLSKSLLALCAIAMSTSAMMLHEKRSSIPSGFVSNGPAPTDQSITLRIALASTDMAGLQSKLLTISDPASAEYGNWLSQAEVRIIQISARLLDHELISEIVIL